MMRTPRYAAFLALALLAGACDLQLPGTEVAVSPDAVADAQPGGRLRVGIVQPAGVDPLDAYEPGAMLISSLVCEPLVHLDPTTGEVVPGLAKKVQVAGEGTTVTIELPRDVLTHDGSRLQADDLLATYFRLASPANASRVRSILEPVQGYEEIAGDLLAEGQERLTGVVALNDLSIQMNLVLKDPGFLHRLAHPAMAPISGEAVAADPRGFRDMPVCAGPYRMTEPFDAGASALTIERFEDYHGANPAFTSGGVGYADRIEFRFYADREAAQTAYQRDEIDVLRIPGTAVAELAAERIITGPAPDVEFIGFPVGLEGPFSDPEVRRTLSRALDREELVDRVWGGTRQPATGFFPPALAEVYEPESCSTVPASSGVVGDLPDDVVDLYDDVDLAAYDRAMEQLRERAAEGFDEVVDWDAQAALIEDELGDTSRMLPINVNVDGRYPAMALEIARQWREAFGIASFPVVQNWRDYSRNAVQGQGFAGAFRISWATSGGVDPVVTVADPRTYLGPMFETTASNLGNWARWTHREFDLDLNRYAIGTSDGTTRNQMYRDLEQVLCEELPLIPIAFGEAHWLVKERWQPAIEPVVGTHDGQLSLRELYQADGG